MKCLILTWITVVCSQSSNQTTTKKRHVFRESYVMSATTKALEIVEIKSNHTVFGFNREASNLFNINIPIPITSLCLSYYFMDDNWDKNCIGKAMEVCDNACLIKRGDSYGGCTAFLSKEFDSGIHSWTFKIRHVWIDRWGESLSWQTALGIFPASKIPPQCVTNTAFIFSGGYGFCYRMGRSIDYHKKKYYRKYGKRCYVDDIIEMIVDCDKGEMRYRINGTEYENAYNIIKHRKYRAAVALFCKGDSIQLL